MNTKNMYQTIHEPISVSGVYANSRFLPKKFQWRKRIFTVDSICAIYDLKDGTVRKRRFSVISNKNVFLLEFDREQEHWVMEQLWVE